MSKNLYRLRLLDFFELTAATGAALYIYQSGGWFAFEKRWVIAAVAIAAPLIWIATRLGKTTPTPGLFLAAYLGALYGLFDLSPWIVLFGRLAVIDAARSCFPESLPSRGWQERTMTITLITCFMATPAIFFSCVWASLAQVFQLARRKWQPPKSKWSAAALACQSAIALIFLAGLSYYALRPQIRHVGTIRIPINIPPGLNDWESAMLSSPFSNAWTISSEGDLLVLSKDMTLRKYDLSDCKVIDERRLASPKIPSSVSSPSIKVTDELLAWYTADHFATMWNIAPSKLLVKRWIYQAEYTGPLEIYDLSSNAKSPTPLLFGDAESVVAISNTGAYVATRGPHSVGKSHEKFAVYETATGRCLTEFRKPMNELRGQSIRLSPEGELGFESRIVDSDESSTNKIAPHPFNEAAGNLDVTERRYPDGVFTLTERGLKRLSERNNELTDNWKELLFAFFEPKHARVVLLSYHPNNPLEVGQGSALPVIEHLLHDAQCAQPTLYYCDRTAYRTSRLRHGLLRIEPFHPKPQFTPDGRSLVVQIHEPTADLFHIFSIP